jgi:DNA replication protein DnaC
MLLEQTLDKLNAMKLFALAKSLQERLERQDHQSLSKAEFVGLLVDDEWLYRENRKLSGRLRVAKFKDRAAAIEAVNYKTARGLRKDQLLELAQNRWITAHQSVLITGLSGSGKSFVAQALGQHACRSGFSVQYLRLPALLNQFVLARAEGTYDRLLKRLAKLSVLIVDDFGMGGSLSDREKQDLLEAIEERYGSGSTVVTAQLPVSDWHEYLGGGRVADAILDRLVHNAHRIELRSEESLRKEYSGLNHGGQSVE